MADDEVRNFETWDWVLFAAMLAVSAGIGIFYAVKEFCSEKKNTTGEFLMGGRNMQLFPVAVSILVSFMSAILILGTPAEMYTAGTLYFTYLLGMILAIILSTILFVPLLYPLTLTSSFEYLELRFNSKYAKLTGTLIMIVQQILYMGIASYAPSTALEAGNVYILVTNI
ncbi:sodium-coupled monocarboxylate transporter 2-like isoform X1 [Ruditapes philippinarum]|uniref:sodium-coupled monocarboxylate transporter 2-like isoform X1 n=1 Tax=Ruditapes philippinarum TaxID=129788 RepID=UPI00295AEE1F|nr:sodium-coupled monocarboxylate transporter 2-like isoform X1 [Ruditapes philippinarum]